MRGGERAGGLVMSEELDVGRMGKFMLGRDKAKNR